MRLILCLAIVAILVGCAEATEPKISEVSDTYAVLAVVPGKGRMFHGYAKRESGSVARKAAMSKCSNYDCTVVQEYSPGQCVHIVLGDDQIYWNNTGFTPERKQDVLAFCNRIDENCRFIVSECLR